MSDAPSIEASGDLSLNGGSADAMRSVLTSECHVICEKVEAFAYCEAVLTCYGSCGDMCATRCVMPPGPPLMGACLVLYTQYANCIAHTAQISGCAPTTGDAVFSGCDAELATLQAGCPR